MLDLENVGANWDFARNHGLACKIGKPIQNPTTFAGVESMENEPIQAKHNLCPCCLNAIHKQQLPLCGNSKEIEFIGFGFPLYFIFIKYAIILLLLQIVTYNILSLDWAILASFDICQQAHVRELPNHHEGVCTSWLIKLIRTEQSVSREEVILRFTSFFIHLAGLIYMRDMMRKTNDYYFERTSSLSDYSIIITNIPKHTPTEKMVRHFLENAFLEKEDQSNTSLPFKAQEIILINQLEVFYRIRDQKREIIKQKQKWMNKNGENLQKLASLEKIQQRLIDKEIELKMEYKRQKQSIKKQQAACQKAIVVMENPKQKKRLLQLFKSIGKEKLIQFFGEEGVNLQIGHAPEPKQIIWENINLPKKKRVFRILLGWVLSILFIAAVAGVFYGILSAKGHAVQSALKKAKQNPGDPQAHTLQQKALAATILIILLIIFFNKFCLSVVLHIFTDMEKHRTGSQYQFSFGLKYTLALFFTTAVMTLIVQINVFNNIYSEKYGVAQQESITFFFNSFLVPIIWLVNPWRIFKSIKRWYWQGSKVLTQHQANELMEDSRYSMGKKYGQIIQSIWFTYLYYSVIPIGAILMFFGLIFYYWVDKFNLLRRSSISENVSGELSMHAMKLLDLSLVLRGIGELVFDSQIRSHTSFQSIICICVGMVYLLLPADEILIFLHKERYRKKQQPYSHVRGRFIENYQTMHPLFQEERYALINGVDLITQVIALDQNKNHQGKLYASNLIHIRPSEHSLLEIMEIND